jgi:hypothetical protein
MWHSMNAKRIPSGRVGLRGCSTARRAACSLLLPTYYSLLTTHDSLQTTDYTLLTTQSPLSHHSLLATYYKLLTAGRSASRYVVSSRSLMTHLPLTTDYLLRYYCVLLTTDYGLTARRAARRGRRRAPEATPRPPRSAPT